MTLRLGDTAPDFEQASSLGPIKFHQWLGDSWGVLFSHPADFTPVCTSEFVAFAKAADRFSALNCALLALSVDSLFSHLAWIRSIHAQFGVVVPFPIIEDPSMAIAQAYGMISPRAHDSAMVRAIFVIDPDGIIRAISWYPMTTGRSVAELLRLVAALQMTDAHGVSTPEAWQPGQDVILPPQMTTSDALEAGGAGNDWYYRTAAPDALPAAGKRRS